MGLDAEISSVMRKTSISAGLGRGSRKFEFDPSMASSARRSGSGGVASTAANIPINDYYDGDVSDFHNDVGFKDGQNMNVFLDTVVL